jgi:hypothetical protein
MTYRKLPPVAAVIGYIDCINRGDLAGPGTLMTDDHELVVFDEEALRGRTPNMEAWEGYAASFPRYAIYARDHRAARRMGRRPRHTTGSHLGLTYQEERALSVIWLAEVRNGQPRCWRFLADIPECRSELGLGQFL